MTKTSWQETVVQGRGAPVHAAIQQFAKRSMGENAGADPNGTVMGEIFVMSYMLKTRLAAIEKFHQSLLRRKTSGENNALTSDETLSAFARAPEIAKGLYKFAERLAGILSSPGKYNPEASTIPVRKILLRHPVPLAEFFRTQQQLLVDAETLCHRIATLYEANLEEYDAPEFIKESLRSEQRLFRKYATSARELKARVETLIGQMETTGKQAAAATR